ncbi:M23 family metallopeptidase [Streptomyces nodosus]
MSKYALSFSSRTSRLRVRAAVLAAGIGAVALGAGGAAASGTTAAHTPVHTVAAAPVAATTTWAHPVKSYALSAGFNQAGSMWRSTHSGQDFAVPSGTNVAAVNGGTIVKAGGNGAGDGPAYGNAIVIKHPSGMYTQYAHLSRIDVRVGQTVTTGQHIALSGNTGNSSGPHLHFEVRTTPNYGSAVDPLAFLRGKGLHI